MRQLTQCPSCKRQFDATGHVAGERYHCHCGASLHVPAARSHDAAVVRCSQCGGSRQKDEIDCRYCGGSFTLHERDLHTICPSCLARISDRARFCHHCATPIGQASSLGTLTPRPCPVCGDAHKLTHRALAHASAVLECGRCAGLWISSHTFVSLTRKALEEAAPVPEAGKPHAITAQSGPMYRRCVECSQLMARQNFGRKSGVIIDVCRAHGLWLDVQELERILQWLRAGNRPAPRPSEERRPAPSPMPMRGSSTSLDVASGLDFGGAVIELVVGLFEAIT